MKELHFLPTKDNSENRLYMLFSSFMYNIFGALTHAIVYLLISPQMMLPALTTSLVFFTAMLLCYYVFFRREKYTHSKVTMLLLQSLHVITLVFFVYGTDSGVQYSFLLFSLIPLTLFAFKQLIPWFSYFLVNLGLFVYAQFFYHNQWTHTVLPEHLHIPFQVTILIISMLTLALIIWMFYYTSEQRERILSIHNETLESLNDTLDESNVTKEKFLNIIGHDLRNPLANLLGFSEQLHTNIDTLEKESVKEYSKYIFESAQNANLLILNLLSWSKNQANRLQLNTEILDINEIVQENLHLAQAMAQQKGIDIDYKPEEAMKIPADRNMLNTVIRNLIANAIKFTSKSGQISITTSREKSMCKISIADNGLGISESKLKSILSSYNESISSTGTEGELGTGLGLSLVKEFIERNKGNIEIKSQINIGTEVNIRLPLTK